MAETAPGRRSPRTEYRVACQDPEGHLLSPTPNEEQATANARTLARSTNLTCGPHRVEVRTVYTTPWRRLLYVKENADA